MNNDKFQGICLEASEGHLHMTWPFDEFPKSVRKHLQDSAFNICPACILDRLHEKRVVEDYESCLHGIINEFEAELRKGE